MKANAPSLAPHLCRGAAARAIVAHCIALFQANAAGVARSTDPEYVHQARIALRRLRSALRLFRDDIGRRRAQRWRDALGDAARALGEARDSDVFATETLPKLTGAYGDLGLGQSLAAATTRRRNSRRGAARAALRSPAQVRTVARITRWASEPSRDEPGTQPLGEFAARALRKRHRRLARAVKGIEALDAAARHRLRIDVKRMRYCTEALSCLFKPRRVARYRGALEALQARLGDANDAVTARALLPRRGDPQFLAFAQAWLGERERADCDGLPPLARRLEAASPFWKHPATGQDPGV